MSVGLSACIMQSYMKLFFSCDGAWIVSVLYCSLVAASTLTLYLQGFTVAMNTDYCNIVMILH